MNAAELTRRRTILSSSLDGAILIVGNDESPRNYPANAYPFRQDSHFLYFTGIAAPGLSLLIQQDGGVTLYGDSRDTAEIVWSGPAPTVESRAAEAGIASTAPRARLAEDLAALGQQGVPVHYLPPYRDERRLQLSRLLQIPVTAVDDRVSPTLAAHVARMRSVKSEAEVGQIERAIATTIRMFDAVLCEIAPGRTERDILATLSAVAARDGMPWAFTPIVSVHGEVLHNHGCAQTLRAGDLLLLDIGVEAAPTHYCSDITRTFPVSGRFDPPQRAVYEIVREANRAAVATAGPGVPNTEVHKAAVRVITRGLKDLRILRGDEEEAARLGAHTLFFPHGIGHMLGLDVHDMEDLGPLSGLTSPRGEPADYGLHLLRLTRPLEPGNVVTIEPGIYFIPPLLEQWRREKHLAAFIDYAAVERFVGVRGIRIEDDIRITETGAVVLGSRHVPAEPGEIEARMAAKNA